MSDTKDNDSSEENEERRRRNKARLEGALTPKGVPGRHVPIKGPARPAPRADFKKWARRDVWHTTEEGPMLIHGFEPVDVQAHWWRSGFEDILNDIQETAHTSIKAGRLREWENPRCVLAWAREKGYSIPKKLEDAVNRFHPKCEGRPQGDADRPKWPWGSHETKLLQYLAGAANKFWKLYDPSDPTTAPKNREVIDWLKEQDVADRNAKVMATILRADGLPTGPRK